MPLESMKAMMDRAQRGGYALGYFEAWDSYSMEAALEAAEEEHSPVILGFGGMMADKDWLDNGGVELLGATGSAIALRASVQVCLLLNEAQTMDQALKAMDFGFNAVMLDTSDWNWDEAVETVTQLTHIAHACGVDVEAELGRLPDATTSGIDSERASRTDPQRAAEFVAATGIDCLAVSIGNVHLLTAHDAPVDLDLLEAIQQRVSVPLVIHGGTSFPPDAVLRAIECGVVKFNVGTVLKEAFLEAVANELGKGLGRVSAHDLLGSHKDADIMSAGKAAMKEKVRERLRLYGSIGRARRLHSEGR
jgi:ketose-bisphosphate aldolase